MRSVNPQTGIKGMDVVLSNLQKEIKQIKGRSKSGLIEAAIIIRRDMEHTSPTIPADTGNLRASWFVVTSTSVPEGGSPSFKGDNAAEMSADHASAISENRAVTQAIPYPVLIMGFSANYALWVHEMVDAQFSGRPGKKPGRPGSGAKFLESALKRNKGVILEAIQKHASIKG